jgi:chromosome segregation ATPase
MSSSESPGSTHRPDAASGSPAESNLTADEVLKALSGFEAGLTNLRSLYMERSTLQQQLEARESQLQARERDVGTRTAKLAEESAAIADARKAVDVDRAGVADARADLASRLAQLTSEKDALVSAREQLERDRSEFAKDEEILRSLTDDLSLREKQHEQHVSRLEADRAELKQRAAQIEQESSRLTEREARAAAKEAEFQSTAAKIEAQRDALTREAVALKAQIAEIERREDAIDARDRDLARREGVLAEERTAIDAARDELAKGRTDTEALHRRVRELETQLVAARGRLSETELEASGLRADLGVARTESESFKARVAELTAAADSARAAGDEAAAGAQRLLADLTAERDLLAEQLKSLRADEEELRAKLEAAAESRSASVDAEVSKLRDTTKDLGDRLKLESARSEALTQQIAQLERELESQKAASAKLEAGAAAAASSGADAQEQRRLIADLERALSQQSELNRRLSAELATGKGGVASAGGAAGVDAEWIRRRHARLSHARMLVKDQSRKIRRAGEVLHKRYEQCEQILSQRIDVIQAKQAVDALSRRVQSTTAKAKAGTLVFFSVCIIGILGALSWHAAGQFAPGIYAAVATLSGGNKDRELSADELGAWSESQQAIFKDPQFIEFAAKRMAQRGIVGLSMPGALTELINAAITINTPKPGEIVVELRGEGGARSERVLDTLVVAAVSQANSQRERRADGAMSEVRTPARAGAAPLDQTRLYWAGGLWGGSTLLAFIAALLAWIHLAKAKASFDISNQVEPLMDDSRWPNPRA